MMRDLIIDEILGSKWYQDLSRNEKDKLDVQRLSYKGLLEALKKSLDPTSRAF